LDAGTGKGLRGRKEGVADGSTTIVIPFRISREPVETLSRLNAEFAPDDEQARLTATLDLGPAATRVLVGSRDEGMVVRCATYRQPPARSWSHPPPELRPES